jgi:quercetin dioxygenase-like cupin family protein
MLKGQKPEPIALKSPYQKWAEAQGVPIIKDFYIEDLRTVPLQPWAFRGGTGAIINLIGTGDLNEAYLSEIPPGGSLKPLRMMYEETVFVVEGNGSTAVWTDEKKKVTFEWGPGAIFAPPLNTWRQHFNASGTKPARLLVVTSAPPVMSMFRNMDFIFNNNYVFNDRFDADAESFSGAGVAYERRGRHVWDTNVVADVRKIELFSSAKRGAGGSNIQIELGENAMAVHISQFPVGTYKKAHRHGPGAHVVIIGGEGYSLMWPEGEEPKRFDWHDGTIIVPPERWFHQHFNTGAIPARYLAIRAGGAKFGRPWGKDPNMAQEKSLKEGGDQIEYEDEDPKIRQEFEEALKKSGAKSGMDAVIAKEKAKASAA